MKRKQRANGLVAMMMVAVLLVGLLPTIGFADYTELSVGTVWPSSQRTFPREVMVINCDRLIIHEHASFSSREVLSATRGRRFTATGMDGNFIEIQLDGGGVGYGYASYLEPGAQLAGSASPYSRVYNTPFGGYAFMPYRYWRVTPDVRPHPRPHPRPQPDPLPNPQPGRPGRPDRPGNRP